MRAILQRLFERELKTSRRVEKTIRDWRRQQMRPWRKRTFVKEKSEAEFRSCNATEPMACLFKIAGSRVTKEPKPDFDYLHPTWRDLFLDRSERYLRFFQESVAAYPLDRDGLFVMEMNDRPRLRLDAPVFAFQKRRSDTRILLHDIDFVAHDFDAGNRPKDELAFDAKDNRAVFAGSTTGMVNTRESVDRLENPRVAAFVFFKDKPGVDFG